MKKIISLFLLMIMAISVVSCDGEPSITTTNKIERGTISSNTYVCETLGITFVKPDLWYYYTDEEIASLLNITVDSLLGERFEAVLDSNVSIYDMMVQDSVSGTNLMLGYENLKLTMSTNMNERQYIEAVKNQLKSTSMGAYVSFPYSTDTAKLGNVEFTRLVYENTMYGYTMTQVMYVRKLGNYMGFVTVTINSGYTIEDIEEMFR